MAATARRKRTRPAGLHAVAVRTKRIAITEQVDSAPLSLPL